MTTPEFVTNSPIKETKQELKSLHGDSPRSNNIPASVHADQRARRTKCCKAVLILGFMLLVVGAILTGVILGR
jgi:hypothetical protein